MADYDDGHVGIWLKVLGVIGILFGLSLALPGIYLITLGGTWYYAIAGIATVVAGWMIFRGNPKGVLVYLGVCALAVIWGFIEVWNMQQWFWPMIPRLFAFAFALIFILLSVPRFPSLKGDKGIARTARLGALAVIAGLVLTIYGMFQPHGFIQNDFSPSPQARQMAATAKMGDEWRSWSGSNLGNRFQPASQINKDTIENLEVAWTYRTGRIANDSNSDQSTSLYANNTVFACTYDNEIHAIDGVTGAKKWVFVPDPKVEEPFFMRCRGLAFHEQGSANDSDETAGEAEETLDSTPAAMCTSRVIMATRDTRLYAVDAETGTLCPDFGENGMVDMKAGMGDFESPMYGFTSAPYVALDTIILGGYLNDNISTLEPSGVIRAVDAVTGDLRWAFDVGRPGEKGLPKGDETYTKGTPNMWTHPAIDEELGLVYIPTGNSTPDVYGLNRRPFDNEYNAAVVALDIRTGDERWKFNTVNRDLWDFDLPSQPSLYDVTHPETGELVKVLIQPTKRQDLFMLNRETGEPVAEVVEKQVTTEGGIPEISDWLAPTQPYSVGMPKISGNKMSAAEMWGTTPIDQLSCRIHFRKTRYTGDEFVPPSTEWSLQAQGPQGGFNWGSGSIDENNGIYVINDLRLPMKFRLIPRDEAPEYPELRSGHDPYAPQFGTPYGLERAPITSWLGLLCQQPPWGSISGIDLNTQELVWTRPIGTVKHLDFLGISTGLSMPMGMPSLGGSTIIGSGLAFFGSAMDHNLYALDTATGETVWKDEMPVGATAAPISYVGADGRQYIVISAGGSSYATPDRRGDYVIAYALPKE